MKTNVTSILVQSKSIFFLVTHLRLSSWFYATQLMDMFSYEIQIPSLIKDRQLSLSPLYVYNFSSLVSHNRFIIFAQSNRVSTWKTIRIITSIGDLFLNAIWLERELGEMGGQNFEAQRDSRNLLLMYGDVSMPILKASPSIGLREMVYDAPSDIIIQVPTSIQF